MKTRSAKVSKPVNEDFLEHARRIRPRTSLTGLKPLNLGKTLRPLTSRDDLLVEMLGAFSFPK
jgi:hypothetical protein